MNQPVKGEILNTDYYKNNPYINKKDDEYILLIDGHTLLKLSMVNKTRNSREELIGPIVQFLWKMKEVMQKREFNHVYVFWDGENSGLMRWELYSGYKKRRHKQYSEYDRKINAFVNSVLSKKEKNDREKEEEKERYEFTKLRMVLHTILEDLFVRQVIDNEDGTECDDLIAYFCLNKKENQKIFIMTTDFDIHQLISDSIMIYDFHKKTYFHNKNYKELCGIPPENVMIKKILVGDTSDNITGIDQLGEKKLFDFFPEIKERPVTVNEIIEHAKKINSERKKPLKFIENIINGTTKDNRENIYEINEKLINLKKPLLGKNVMEEMDEIMNNPLSIDDRSIENVYKIIVDYEITELKGNFFSSFFMPFKKLSNKEKEYYKNFYN